MAKIKVPDPGEVRRTRIGECVVKSAELIIYPRSRPFIRYLYEDFLQKLAQDMHENEKKDYDNIIIIEGGEGSGKSNLAWNLFNAYSPGFDVKSAYIYNIEGMRERFKKEDYGGKLFWMDETSVLAGNRKWMTKDNQDFVEILETHRSKSFVFICCIPHKERSDLYLRDYRARYVLKCSPMKFPIDKGKKRMRGYFELWKRDEDTDELKHVGYGEYPIIPPEEKQKYETIKADFQEKFRQRIANGEEKPTKYKEKYVLAQNKNIEIMTKLHDLKLVDDTTLMDLFGYDNKKTYQNAMSRARQRNEI